MLVFCFTQFSGRSHCLKFGKFRNTAPLIGYTSVHMSSFTGRSAIQENNKGDTVQFDGPAADEEAELKELEFRARALESLVRARERQMKIEQG